MTARLTDSREVEAFRNAAQSYCELIDSRSTVGFQKLLAPLEVALAELVAAAGKLPDLNNLPEAVHADLGPYFDLASSLGEFFGTQNVFREIFDPYDQSDEPVTYSMSHALADAYCAVSPGLQAWTSASAAQRRRIVWDWWFNFRIDWGHSAIDAIRAIHSLLFLSIGEEVDGSDD